MRLFIAVNFDDELKRRILAVQDRLREQSRSGKFPLPENFHLTLVFPGETPEDRLPEIREVMERISAPVFELEFCGTGFFKRAGKELWWLGTGAESPALKRLADLRDKLAADLLERGFSLDTRAFNAHITLGREIRYGGWPFKTEKIGVPVKRISLMRSERRLAGAGASSRGGQVYTELFGRDLGF